MKKILKSAFVRLECENATFNKSFYNMQKGKLIWVYCFLFNPKVLLIMFKNDNTVFKNGSK